MRVERDALGRVDIKSLSVGDIAELLDRECGGTGRRARAVYKALWQRGVSAFSEIVEVSKRVRSRLDEVAYISFLAVDQVLESDDGTRKYLWRLSDGRTIESVLIPDGDRVTLCMSSQVGCAMACTFCLTGDLGLKRNLSPAEIANQPLQVAADLPPGMRITNLVMMGMGEPLHNLDNLCAALDIALDDHGLNFSHRKVTVSTVGLVPKIIELAARSPVNLAISLNATTEEQRAQIMPITKRYSMAELLETCRTLPLPPGKRITFEYVMLRGFNDSQEDARRLVELMRDQRAKVNLIPYNENPDRDIQRPDDATVRAFQDTLVKSGVAASVRTTRGIDISAACGQLGKAGAVTAAR